MNSRKNSNRPLPSPPPPLKFGKLCCHFFRQTSEKSPKWRSIICNINLEVFRKLIRVGSVTLPKRKIEIAFGQLFQAAAKNSWTYIRSDAYGECELYGGHLLQVKLHSISMFIITIFVLILFNFDTYWNVHSQTDWWPRRKLLPAQICTCWGGILNVCFIWKINGNLFIEIRPPLIGIGIALMTLGRRVLDLKQFFIPLTTCWFDIYTDQIKLLSLYNW